MLSWSSAPITYFSVATLPVLTKLADGSVPRLGLAEAGPPTAKAAAPIERASRCRYRARIGSFLLVNRDNRDLPAGADSPVADLGLLWSQEVKLALGTMAF